MRGLTSILLDTSADGVADVAYAVMEQVLDDLPTTDEFLATPLKRARFIRRIGENLVLQEVDKDENKTKTDKSGSSSRTIITISVISALTAFVLTALFFCGLSRNQERKEQEKVNMRLAYYHAKRRKFWSQLQEDEDNHTYPGLMMTEPAPIQTVTWSVSDITSESASIKSAMKMDRIEEEYEGGSNESRAGDMEEGGFEDHYEETKEENHDASPLARPSLEIPPFIAHWQDDHSELATRGSNLADRVWDLATMPKSYWDESDPEAPTPDHSPVGNFRSPTGCAYLQDGYGEENSFADNELDFSSDSPCKLPAVTYTTEEEEHSQASSAAGTRRQSSSVQESLLLRPMQSFETSEDDPVVSAGESLDTMPEKACGKNVVMAYCYKTEENASEQEVAIPTEIEQRTQEQQKKSVDPDPVVTSSIENTPVSEEDTSYHSPSEESLSEDSAEEESTSTGFSPSISSHKADIFYTPKQDATGPDSLKSVAQTIVLQAHVYDEATQKWARQVLAEMTSPKPKLLAATPHHQ